MPAHRNVAARSGAGVRKPPGKEPAVGDVGVAVYGDLTAGRLVRVMRRSTEESAGGLEPVFEADFQPGSFGYRPKRTAHDAIKRGAEAIVQRKTRVLDLTCEPTLTMSGATGCWEKWHSGLRTRTSCTF
jgi:hypothetical protein